MNTGRENRRKLWAILLLVAMLVSMLPVVTYADENQDRTLSGNYKEGEVLALVDTTGLGKGRSKNLFKAEVFESEVLMDVSNLSEELTDKEAGNEQNNRKIRKNSQEETDFQIIHYRSDSMSTVEMMDMLEENPAVLQVQPNYVHKANSVENYADIQWERENKGNVEQGTIGEDHRGMPIYQQGNTGSSDVVVAVMDTGIDYTHPDLKGQMWGKGLDYPELVELGGNKYGTSAADEHNDIMDKTGHGTHISGTIGAQWDNQGTSGINEHVKIMGVRIEGYENGKMYDSAIVKGFQYLKTAREVGVNLAAVNCSFGGVYVPVTYASAESFGKTGAAVIWASGNSNLNLSEVQNGLAIRSPYMINVNASTSRGEKADFSNYGKTRSDVFAPGQNIISTVPKGAGFYFSGSDTYLYKNTFDSPSDDPEMDLYYFDENKENDLGNKVASTSERSMLGDGRSLAPTQYFMEEDKLYTSELVTEPVDLRGKDISTLYAGCEAGLLQSQDDRTLLYMGYRKKDGSFGLLVDQFQSIIYREWVSMGVKIDSKGEHSDIDLEHFQLMIVVQSRKPVHPAVDTVAISREATDYVIWSGTSMAAPVVTGEVALLRSIYPKADIKEITARVIGGVDRSESYKDLCVSQGRISIEKAVKNPNPVPQTSRIEDGQLIVDGYFFGKKPGRFAMDGKEIPTDNITYWSNKQIRCTLPSEWTEEKMVEMNVTRTDGTDGRNFFLLSTEKASFEELPVPDAFTNGEFDIMFGGMDAEKGIIYGLLSGATSEELWSYNINTQQWLKLPNPVYDGGNLYFQTYLVQAAVTGGKLYTTASKTPVANSEKLLEVDLKTGEAKAVSDVLPVRSTLVKDGRYVYIVGGITVNELGERSSSTQVWRYDTVTGKLKQLADLKEGRCNAGIAVSEGTLIVAGGESETGEQVRSTEVYDETKNTWVKYDKFPEYNSSSPNELLQAESVEEGMLITGKSHSNKEDGIFTDCWIFNKNTGEWRPHEKNIIASHSARVITSVYDDYLYALVMNQDAPQPLVFRKIPLKSAEQVKLTTDMVLPIADQVYTGKSVVPKVVVQNQGNTLVEGVDYRCTFGGNIKAGIGIVKVHGLGRYYGNVNTHFTILKAENKLAIRCADVAVGQTPSPVVTKNVSGGKVSFTYKGENEEKYQAKAPKKVGTYTVKAVSAATGNYKSQEAFCTFKIKVSSGGETSSTTGGQGGAQTGDSTNLWPWLFLMLGAAGAAGVLIYKKKSNK